MPPKDAKVWNEDLLQALRAREDLSRREGKRDQIARKQGADAIEAVRKQVLGCPCGDFLPFVSDVKGRQVDC